MTLFVILMNAASILFLAWCIRFLQEQVTSLKKRVTDLEDDRMFGDY